MIINNNIDGKSLSRHCDVNGHTERMIVKYHTNTQRKYKKKMVLYFVSSNINLIQMIVVVAMVVAATTAAMPDIKCATHDYSLMDRG